MRSWFRRAKSIACARSAGSVISGNSGGTKERNSDLGRPERLLVLSSAWRGVPGVSNLICKGAANTGGVVLGVGNGGSTLVEIEGKSCRKSFLKETPCGKRGGSGVSHVGVFRAGDFATGVFGWLIAGRLAFAGFGTFVVHATTTRMVWMSSST